MNMSRLFIIRPVATSLLMLAIFIAGFLAYRLLPVSALPEVDYPTLQVTTLYPGASPDVVTSGITAPLERQFGQMPGLAQMASVSSGGASVITLRFSLKLGLNVAEQEVQAAINAASNLLPNDLPTPPVYSKVNPADAPVLTLAITSPSLSLNALSELVENRVSQKLSQVQGVGLVGIAGGQRPAIRIQVNPKTLATLGLSFEDIRLAITAANVNQAKGAFDGPYRSLTLDANDQLSSASQYQNLILAYKKGNPVRLKDIATVVEDAENIRLAAWANTEPAIILNVQRQPGANVIDTVDRIQTLLPQIRAALPPTVDLQVLTDRTSTIRASVKDVQTELLLAVALVVTVIFFFLRSASATLIPGIAVPISLVGSFAFMYLAGFSINNLTLMALTVATGFVVDDAIVVVENIARHREAGLSPLQAALKGSQEIGFTIVSLTVSLVAVLIPLLFMQDVAGRLFHEFAITLAVSIVISAVVSLTLTPMLCARFLKPENLERHGKVMTLAGKAIEGLISQYARALNWVLARRVLTLWVFGGSVMLTAILYYAVPKGFFPVQDTGLIQVITQAEQSISFSAMQGKQQEVAQALLEEPSVTSLSSFIGVDGANATLNTGRMLLNLKPKGVRDLTLADLLENLKQRTAGIQGMQVYFLPIQDLTIEDKTSPSQYALTLMSPSQADLSLSNASLLDAFSALPELQGVSSDLQEQGLQAYIEIDREAAGRLNVTVAAIDAALYNAFGQRLISTIYTQANQYRVVLEMEPKYKAGLAGLESIYVPSASGTQIPLSALATLVEKPTLLANSHLSQFPSATLSFTPAPSVALGDAVAAMRTAIEKVGLPAGVETGFQGAALAFEASLSSTLFLILAAVVTMYIVLGVLYESYVHPLTILSTLPSAAIGALMALLLTRMELSLIAVIGIILLIGIVKKNAIMMIDFALDAEREQGLAPRQAIEQACLLRFRPILMTTLAALLGALPLMLGTGIGSELRQPLGVTMVGGLIVSQLLTLFTTPVIYLCFSDILQRRRGAQVSESETA